MLLFVFSCDSNPFTNNSHEVIARIYSFNTHIYSFDIFHNDDLVFTATECGSNNNEESCVDFEEGNVYNYEFVAQSGDFIGMIVTSQSTCDAGVSAIIYVDNVNKESKVESCDNCFCNILSINYTIN